MMWRLIRAEQDGARPHAITSINTDFDASSVCLFGDDRHHSTFDEKNIQDRSVRDCQDKIARQINRLEVLCQRGEILGRKMRQQAVADCRLLKHGGHALWRWHRSADDQAAISICSSLLNYRAGFKGRAHSYRWFGIVPTVAQV